LTWLSKAFTYIKSVTITTIDTHGRGGGGPGGRGYEVKASPLGLIKNVNKNALKPKIGNPLVNVCVESIDPTPLYPPPSDFSKNLSYDQPRFSTVCIYDDNQIEKQKIYFLHVYIFRAEQKEY
jgi:hypothetical protein